MDITFELDNNLQLGREYYFRRWWPARRLHHCTVRASTPVCLCESVVATVETELSAHMIQVHGPKISSCEEFTVL